MMSRQNQSSRNLESFGDAIKRLREALALPQRKIAAQLDIDSSTLSKLERNERQPTAEIISKLSQLYNVDADYLLVCFYSDRIINELQSLPCSREVLETAILKLKSTA